MNAKLLSISIVPMLLIGAGQLLASVKFNISDNWHLSRSRMGNSEIRLVIQQPPPPYLAKDDKQKECVWLGLCDGKDKK